MQAERNDSNQITQTVLLYWYGNVLHLKQEVTEKEIVTGVKMLDFTAVGVNIKEGKVYDTCNLPKSNSEVVRDWSNLWKTYDMRSHIFWHVSPLAEYKL